MNNCLAEVVNVLPSQLTALQKWIHDGDFAHYESPRYKLSASLKRPHNYLYQFVLPSLDYRVVMKVAHIHKDYNPARRLSALYKYYRRCDANYRAFRCCRYAYRHRLAAPQPLAYWQRRDSLTQVKSYFLYRYAAAYVPWAEIATQLNESEDGEITRQMEWLKRKMLATVKRLHQANIRHGDITTHNALLSIPNSKWERTRVCFIDYDRSTFVRMRRPACLKRFFDLSDLRKLYINGASPYDLLGIYLGKDYNRIWRVALAFWRFAQYRKSRKR